LRPHWISKRSNFWFRRNNAPEDFTFVYVDPTQGVHRPAFDHEGVARALRVQGVKASATNLPFSWIDTKEGPVLLQTSER
jgi:hypothetical protein